MARGQTPGSVGARVDPEEEAYRRPSSDLAEANLSLDPDEDGIEFFLRQGTLTADRTWALAAPATPAGATEKLEARFWLLDNSEFRATVRNGGGTPADLFTPPVFAPWLVVLRWETADWVLHSHAPLQISGVGITGSLASVGIVGVTDIDGIVELNGALASIGLPGVTEITGTIAP